LPAFHAQTAPSCEPLREKARAVSNSTSPARRRDLMTARPTSLLLVRPPRLQLASDMADSPGYQSDSTAVDKPSPRSSRARPARTRSPRSSASDRRSLLGLAFQLVERIVYSIVYSPFAWFTSFLYSVYQEGIRLVFASSELLCSPLVSAACAS